MLQSIHIKNLALIDEAEVELKDGLNILTGETGAGKSIIIGSVSIALGGRAPRDKIRKGADYALIELDFSIHNRKTIQELEKMDLPLDDGHLVITRRLTGARSISRINGETVSLSVVRKAAALLIDIHGQYEHQSLLHKEKHLAIIDAFAGERVGALKAQTTQLYAAYTRLQKEEQNLMTDEGKRSSEIDFLKFQIQEIDEAAIREGEEEELDRRFSVMSNARSILENISAVHELMGYDGDSSAGSLNTRAIHLLGQVSRYDEAIDGFTQQLSNIDGLLNDFNRDLADYMESLTFDEADYRQTEERLDTISRISKKYGGSVQEINAYRSRCADQLERLENYDAYAAKVEEDLQKTRQQLDALCSQLTAERKKEAAVLEKKIADALGELNFADVRFEIRGAQLDHYTAGGKDNFEFLISTNPGEDVKPLGQVASGGELSRIMLAIKSVLADTDDIETLIFDEIDTGISGRTAQKVSERMAYIASSHQVICITHLPQIASMADYHLIIEKKIIEGRAVTTIRPLGEEDTVREIARLLGGVKITETVLGSAREMLQLAADSKEKLRSGEK